MLTALNVLDICGFVSDYPSAQTGLEKIFKSLDLEVAADRKNSKIRQIFIPSMFKRNNIKKINSYQNINLTLHFTRTDL